MALTRDDLQAISDLMDVKLQPINDGFDGLQSRMDRVDNRLDKMDIRFERMGTGVENRTWLEKAAVKQPFEKVGSSL